MNPRLFFVLLSVICIATAYSQVKVSGNATGKHAKAINTAKQSREETKARKEQAKQIKEQSKAIKTYESRYEKLKKQKLRRWEKDSVAIPTWTPADSLEISKEVLGTLPPDYQQWIRNPVSLDSLDANAIATDVGQQSANVLEQQAEAIAKDQVGELEGLDVSNINQGLSQFVVPRSRPNPNLVKPDVARELFKQIDPNQFQEVQKDLAKKKKKYSSLPDVRYPEEGRKRNSLEGTPFKKRLHVNGILNLASSDPLIVDASLQLGYWMNKIWMVGLGLNLREQFTKRAVASTGDAHGFSLLTRLDIHKYFYVWAEAQRQVNRGLFSSESNQVTQWEQASLLGIGRDFSIGPIAMTSLILYDFNYQNNQINTRPWVVRIGFQLSKKP